MRTFLVKHGTFVLVGIIRGKKVKLNLFLENNWV